MARQEIILKVSYKILQQCTKSKDTYRNLVSFHHKHHSVTYTYQRTSCYDNTVKVDKFTGAQ